MKSIVQGGMFGSASMLGLVGLGLDGLALWSTFLLMAIIFGLTNLIGE